MAKTNASLIRYITIDKCLRNRGRIWSKDDLIDACARRLEEIGIYEPPAERTFRTDISDLRNAKVFDEPAPIITYKIAGSQKGYYMYEDPEFSILNTKLPASVVRILRESINMAKQMSVFTAFRDVEMLIHKLDKQIDQQTTKTNIVDFESIPGATGIENFERVYTAIQKHEVLDVLYRPFNRTTPYTVTLHPYLLKEYRNRWFLLALSFRENKDAKVFVFGLERMLEIKTSNWEYSSPPPNIDTFFHHAIGVTVPEDAVPEKIVLAFNPVRGQYVLTKPIHHSQVELPSNTDEVRVSLFTVINRELVREIVSFRDEVEVISPIELRNRIKDIALEMLQKYQ